MAFTDAPGTHDHSFGRQTLPLFGRGRRAGRQRDTPGSIDHAMPGQIGRTPGKGTAHQPRRASQSGAARHLAITHDLPRRDRRNHGVDTAITFIDDGTHDR